MLKPTHIKKAGDKAILLIFFPMKPIYFVVKKCEEIIFGILKDMKYGLKIFTHIRRL